MSPQHMITWSFHKMHEPASVAQLDARPTGDQEVCNILSWRLIMIWSKCQDETLHMHESESAFCSKTEFRLTPST